MDNNTLQTALENSGLSFTPEQIAQLKQAINNTPTWYSLLERDNKGLFKTSPQNYMVYLNNEESLKNNLRFNQIKQKPMLGDRELTDPDIARIYNDTYKLFDRGSKQNFDLALTQVIDEHKYNPIIEYLENQQWDGVKRLETVFIDWLGAEDTALNRAMTKMWFIAAIKRALIPGCQFDNIIVLQCPEGGGGKTTLIKRLGLNFGDGAENYYQELTGYEIDDPKKSAEKLNEGWIISFDELEGLSKKDVNNIKTFLSKTEEKVRMAYARLTSTNKRHCVFIGSTNDSAFLKDYTSSVERRFWVIPITRSFENNIVWNRFTRDIVDQIWAEAYSEYMANPKQGLDIDTRLYKLLSEQQRNFKSFNNDDDMEFYREIFNREFVVNDKLEIASMESFINQMKGTYPEAPGMKKSYIDRIPGMWVYMYIKSIGLKPKTHKYAAAALGLEYKQLDYQGTKQYCYTNGTDRRTVAYIPLDSSTLLNITGENEFN